MDAATPLGAWGRSVIGVGLALVSVGSQARRCCSCSFLHSCCRTLRGGWPFAITSEARRAWTRYRTARSGQRTHVFRMRIHSCIPCTLPCPRVAERERAHERERERTRESQTRKPEGEHSSSKPHQPYHISSHHPHHILVQIEAYTPPCCILSCCTMS